MTQDPFNSEVQPPSSPRPPALPKQEEKQFSVSVIAMMGITAIIGSYFVYGGIKVYVSRNIQQANDELKAAPPVVPVIEPRATTEKAAKPRLTKMPNAEFFITPDEIHQAYSADEDAANNRYKNKTVEITGKVREVISYDLSGEASVAIDVPLQGDRVIGPWLWFDFPKDRTASLQQLKPGMEVSIRGRLEGQFDSANTKNYKVADCWLVTDGR